MNKFYIPAILLLLCQLFSSCEELIDINLNDADPRIVIEADLNNLPNAQIIYVSRTVPFNDVRPKEIVGNAQVQVMGPQGSPIQFVFSEEHQGYVNSTFIPRENLTYSLRVMVDGEMYESTETMPMRVEVDSVGMLRENIFGDTYYFATLRFQDPAGIDNYYKYNVSVDDKPMKFFAVFSDKFNDGLYITHQIGSVDNDIEMTSQVIIRRQSISESVYRYWNEIQSTNPGSAAPANPTSNITNGALGYFSVSNADVFQFDFSSYQEMTTEE